MIKIITRSWMNLNTAAHRLDLGIKDRATESTDSCNRSNSLANRTDVTAANIDWEIAHRYRTTTGASSPVMILLAADRDGPAKVKRPVGLIWRDIDRSAANIACSHSFSRPHALLNLPSVPEWLKVFRAARPSAV